LVSLRRDRLLQYRQRQFEKCKEIEGMYLKMDEIPKTTKNSVKESGKVGSAPFISLVDVSSREQDKALMTTCVFPAGRQVTGSEKVVRLTIYLRILSSSSALFSSYPSPSSCV
jgi:hypothetical protein